MKGSSPEIQTTTSDPFRGKWRSGCHLTRNNLWFLTTTIPILGKEDSASDAEEETTELPPNFNCDDDLLNKVFDFRKDAVNAVYIGMKTKNGTVELLRSLSISHAVIK